MSIVGIVLGRNKRLVEGQLGVWNKLCFDEHLHQISQLITEWKEVAPALGLTPSDEADITGHAPFSVPAQRLHMLRMWKQKVGTAATYQRLADAFSSCARQDLVDKIRELVSSTAQQESTVITSSRILGTAGTQNRNLAEKLIEQQGSLPVRSLKAFFIGPPRVGKTTARRRLTKEITNISPDEIVPSTGIEPPLTVELYHPTEQSSVLLSTEWRCQGLEELCSSICSCVLNSSADPPTSSSSSSTSQQPRQSSPESTIAAHSSTQHLSRSTSLTQSTKDDVTTTLAALVAKQDWESIRERLKNLKDLTFLQIIDVGGQPEFHEILPLLLHGLALNLIFLNVMQNLDSPYQVVYRGISGPSQISYNSEFTIREVIQRVLHTISSLQTIGHYKPTAILIGTHLDLAKQGEALDLDKAIQESMKDDYFMKNDILYAVNKQGEETRYIHPLDNVSEDSTDIEELRELITRIVYQPKRFPEEDIPTGALLLLMILRKKFDPHPGWCSKEDCVKIAECLGISREALLGKNGDGVLDDLQNRFGAILFYGDVEGLCDRVIINANIIMGPPSELFVHAFGTTESEPETAKRIRTSGEISHDLMKRVCSNSKKEVSDNSIPTEEIVGLLEARYILYKDARSAASKDLVYFLPSVLSPDPNVVKQSRDPCHLADLLYSSLLFLPTSGFVPLGYFSATAVKLSNEWILDELERFRNRIRFYFQMKKEKLLHVELRLLSTHLEFRVLPQDCYPINPRLMIECREQLSKVLSKVTAAFPHMKKIEWDYGFYCPHALQSGGQPHAARCLTMDEPRDVVCSQKDCRGRSVALENKHKCWFMECEAKEEGNIAAAAGHTFGNNTPTLRKLRTMKGRDGSDLKVVETIAVGDYELFGMHLLLDENEVAIGLLKKGHINEGPENITKAILKKWLTDPSPTAPCTYQHLIKCLRESHMGALADSIEAVVGEESHLATS